jgi:hypothetical protein
MIMGYIKSDILLLNGIWMGYHDRMRWDDILYISIPWCLHFAGAFSTSLDNPGVVKASVSQGQGT